MKRFISLILSALLFASAIISYLCVSSGSKLLPSFGRDYTILRIFNSGGFSPYEISNMRYAAEAASEATAEDDGRLWCDGYSYFTEVQVSRSDKNSIPCKAIVTGGDFFLFHPITFKSGWQYSSTDLHPDRIVIDEKLAFELFGSNDVEDMTLTIGDKTLYVSGVAKLDESKAREEQLGELPLIYIPQNIAEALFGARNFDYYEIMMQNPVDSYAVNALADATAGKITVDVTHRYQVKKIFGILKSFPTRSYRSEAISYPYWENTDRGTEDVLALLMAVSIITFVIFILNIIKFIYERKKR